VLTKKEKKKKKTKEKEKKKRPSGSDLIGSPLPRC
jgi:hypothetical protein